MGRPWRWIVGLFGLALIAEGGLSLLTETAITGRDITFERGDTRAPLIRPGDSAAAGPHATQLRSEDVYFGFSATYTIGPEAEVVQCRFALSYGWCDNGWRVILDPAP